MIDDWKVYPAIGSDQKYYQVRAVQSGARKAKLICTVYARDGVRDEEATSRLISAAPRMRDILENIQTKFYDGICLSENEMREIQKLMDYLKISL